MSTPLKIVLLLCVILIGPVMFVGSRGHSLATAFRKVKVGDTVQTVTTTMGQPNQQVHENLYLKGDLEYRYSVWPVPQLWVVTFKDGKVADKAEMQSP